MGLYIIPIILICLMSTDADLSIDMCENSKTPEEPKVDKLNLVAVAPTTKSISKLCSCLINATSEWNTILITIRRGNKDIHCSENLYDSATLEIIRSEEEDVVTLNKDNLSDYSSEFSSVSAIRFSISLLYSSCGQMYAMQLKESSNIFMTEYSQVTCSYTEVINTPSTSEASTSKGNFLTKSETTYIETHSQTSDAQTTASNSKTGLIVGIVFGVVFVLILLGIPVLCRYRARYQRKTNTNTTASAPAHLRPAPSDIIACRNTIGSTQQTRAGTNYPNVRFNPSDAKSDEGIVGITVIDNSESCHYSALLVGQSPAAKEVYEELTLRHSSSIDNDTTLVENELYA